MNSSLSSLSLPSSLLQTRRDDEQECAAVTVPTRVMILSDKDADQNQILHQEQEQQQRLPASASHACIYLEPCEEKLFQIIVETSEAFARGEIYIPDDDDGEDDEKEKKEANANTNEHIQIQIRSIKWKETLTVDPNRCTVDALFQQTMERMASTTTTATTFPCLHSMVWNGRPITQKDDGNRLLANIGISRRHNCNGGSIILIIPPSRRPTLRVAGGWVRDKLLGLSTHDVDLAVDDFTGVQFARLIKAYAATKTKKQQDLEGLAHAKIGVIASNPAQSKHLETATLKILGIDVDISNLRGQEIYQQDSRIPNLVSFAGTPLEDAERRDFTLNSLFFNLHTRSIEDWTKRGMKDLCQGQLVTPLEPVQTFTDDPLRVLRAVRFAVRYRFHLHPDLSQACRRIDIHQALHRKVSRERVGKELEGMLSGKGAKPVLCLQTIAQLQLAGSVFALPVVGTDGVTAVSGHVLGMQYDQNLDFDSEQARAIRQAGWLESEQLLPILETVFEAHQQRSKACNIRASLSSRVDMRLLPVGVFLLPFRTLRYREKNNKWHNVAQYIFQHGIKFKNTDVRAMTILQDSVDSMTALLREVVATAAAEVVTAGGGDYGSSSISTDTTSIVVPRLAAGLLLRTVKELWPTCLLLSTVTLIRVQQQLQQQQHPNQTSTTATDWIAVANAVYTQIAIDLDLDLCWKMKPLLDGKAVIQALDVPKGPLVGNYMEEQVRWMLLNPSGSKQDCEDHLKTFKRNLEQQQGGGGEDKDRKGAFKDDDDDDDDDNGCSHYAKKLNVESCSSSGAKS